MLKIFFFMNIDYILKISLCAVLVLNVTILFCLLIMQVTVQASKS